MNAMQSIRNLFVTLTCLVALVGLTVSQASADAITWNVAGDGNWDTTTANWTPNPTYADGDDVTFDNTAGGTINLTANRAPGSTTVSATSGTYTFTGSGITTGVLNKSGGGTLVLGNTTNVFDSINWSGGIISISNAPVAGNKLGSGLIDVTDNVTLNATDPVTNGPIVANAMSIAGGKTITFHRTASQPSATYSGKISGAGGILVTGTVGNNWTFNNATNDFSGGITVNGNATFSNNGAMGANSTITLQGGALTIAASGLGKTVNVTTAGVTFNSSGVMFQGLVTGGLGINAGNLGLDNAANNIASIFINSGTLRVGAAGSLGAGAVSYTSNPNNTLIFVNPVGGTFSNALSMSSGADRVIEVTSAGAVIDWNGAVTGNGNFVNKNGLGTFATTNWQATNAININAGTFAMNDTVTSNVGKITVANNATLAGVGSISLGGANFVDVQTGGIVSPGNSAGTLTINGNLTLASGSILKFELGTISDFLDVNGTVTDAGGIIVQLTPIAGYEGGVYELMSWNAGDLQLSDFILQSEINGELQIVGNTLLFVVVPEPSTLVLFVGGALGLAFGARRRRVARG